jgi:hypothetical protein
MYTNMEKKVTREFKPGVFADFLNENKVIFMFAPRINNI